MSSFRPFTINKIRLLVNYYLSLLFYKSKIMSSLYYALFSRSFHREHQAVLEGKIKHIRDIYWNKNNYYLVIRNIHRIEKGLLMRPRKEIFGKNYIKETIDCYEKIILSHHENLNDQVKWFHDVLDMYFNVVGYDEVIDREKQRFLNLQNTYKTDTENRKKHIPYNRLLKEKNLVSLDSFFALSKQRRSVRWFTEEKVPRKLIDKCIEVASQSPSACNRQPFTFYIIDDKNILNKVVDLPLGTTGYAHNIPVFIVVVGNLNAYFDERDRHLIYIDASLASMSFMLALETTGLSSCPINWPDIEKREMKLQKVLNLNNYQRPIMCMAVGYPDPKGLVASSEKKSLDKIRVYYPEDP